MNIKVNMSHMSLNLDLVFINYVSNHPRCILGGQNACTSASTEELGVLEGSHFIKTIRISNYSELSISYVNYVVV